MPPSWWIFGRRPHLWTPPPSWTESAPRCSSRNECWFVLAASGSYICGGGLLAVARRRVVHSRRVSHYLSPPHQHVSMIVFGRLDVSRLYAVRRRSRAAVVAGGHDFLRPLTHSALPFRMPPVLTRPSPLCRLFPCMDAVAWKPRHADRPHVAAVEGDALRPVREWVRVFRAYLHS